MVPRPNKKNPADPRISERKKCSGNVKGPDASSRAEWRKTVRAARNGFKGEGSWVRVSIQMLSIFEAARETKRTETNSYRHSQTKSVHHASPLLRGGDRGLCGQRIMRGARGAAETVILRAQEGERKKHTKEGLENDFVFRDGACAPMGFRRRV